MRRESGAHTDSVRARDPGLRMPSSSGRSISASFAEISDETRIRNVDRLSPRSSRVWTIVGYLRCLVTAKTRPARTGQRAQRWRLSQVEWGRHAAPRGRRWRQHRRRPPVGHRPAFRQSPDARREITRQRHHPPGKRRCDERGRLTSRSTSGTNSGTGDSRTSRKLVNFRTLTWQSSQGGSKEDSGPPTF